MKKFLRIKGFTLIELIIGIGISTILVTMLFSVFKISLSTTAKLSKLDEFENRYQFASQLIRDEVASADFIYKDDEYDSLGFILLIVDEERKDTNTENFKYRYIKYKKDEKNLYRVALNTNTKIQKWNYGGTKNLIAKNLKSINHLVSKEKIVLNFEFELDNSIRKKELILANRTFGELK